MQTKNSMYKTWSVSFVSQENAQMVNAQAEYSEVQVRLNIFGVSNKQNVYVHHYGTVMVSLFE